MDFDNSEEMMNVRVDRIIGETEKGLHVEFKDRQGQTHRVWLGKSRIDYCGDVGDQDVLIELPEWMAEQNGMDHLPD